MKNNYIPALDGIRFLAVTFVLIDHWSGDSLGFPLSYLGVCMFFVLSGFLISRILLSAKRKDNDLNRSHGFSLRQFYIRRTIRIFPIYYLTLGLLFIANVPPVREKIWWLITYNSNNYIAIYEHWLGSVDHLWSLAVEEQFYLFFPFLIFFLAWRNIHKMLIISVLFSIGLRMFFYLRGDEWMRPYVLMFTCLDAFGLGGLLAYYSWHENQRVIQFFKGWSALIVSLIVYVGILFLSHSFTEGHNIVSVVFLRLFESLLSVALIAKLAFHTKEEGAFSELFSGFFTKNYAIYLGKISYGIYIYHNFVYNFYHTPPTYPIAKLVSKLGNFISNPFLFQAVKITILYLITAIIATFSWFLIEKPINKLKDRFGY